MIWPLLVKELRQHTRITAGLVLAALAQYLVVYQIITRDEAPTMLRAATAWTWGTAPILAAFTARRLFVLEQEHSTVQLLRSLPLSPTIATLTKFALGLLVNLAFNLTLLWVTAGFQRSNEIIPLEWVLRLSAQVSAYVFAWFAIATLMAQCGRYRWALWLVLLSALAGLDDIVHEPSRNLFWTAPLADELETTRYQTPWDAVALAVAWGAAALAAAVSLARYRGGSLVDGWFEPMSARRRAKVIAAVFVTLLLLQVFGTLHAPNMDLTDVPHVGRVHVQDPALEAVATRVDAALTEVRQTYGLPEMPRVLLRLRWDERPEDVLSRRVGDDALVIAVRPGAPAPGLDRQILTDVLTGHAGGLLERISRTGLWGVGFGGFVLDDPALALTAARLKAFTEAPLDDYDAVAIRFGRRGADAAGWVAWQALHEVGGDSAVRALAAALFGARRSPTGGGLILARRLDPRAVIEAHDVSWDAVGAAWLRRVQALAAEHPTSPQPLPALTFEPRPDAAPAIAWSGLAAGLTDRRAQLWWSTAADLAPQPTPASAVRATTVTSTAGRVAITCDPRRRIIATWVIDHEVQGWTELPR